MDAGDFIDDPFEYAAQAMERISTMHPFAEGNKRTAFFAALRILNWAGFTLPDTEETYRFALETSMGRHGVDDIRSWLRDNAVALPGKGDRRGLRVQVGLSPQRKCFPAILTNSLHPSISTVSKNITSPFTSRLQYLKRSGIMDADAFGADAPMISVLGFCVTTIRPTSLPSYSCERKRR